MKALRLSNTQKWFALALVVVAMYVAFWSSLDTQSHQQVFNDSLDVAVPVTQSFVLIDPQQDATAVEAAAVLESANKILQQSATDTVQVDVTRSEAWQVDNRRAETPSIPLNEKIVDYTVVEVAADPTTYPQVGEEVVLPMLKGEKVVANVETSVMNPNGDYTWRGHLQGHGDSYPVVMTYGATSVMATITTPAGSYSMTTVNGLGWLYKNPAEVELVDQLKNDFLEPPQFSNVDHHH